jgi:hypothetical protein
VVEQEGWAVSGLGAPLASPGLSLFFAETTFCCRLSFRSFGTRVRGSVFYGGFFFLKKRFQRWANLPSSVSGLEVRHVEVWPSWWARTSGLLMMEEMGRLAMVAAETANKSY